MVDVRVTVMRRLWGLVKVVYGTGGPFAAGWVCWACFAVCDGMEMNSSGIEEKLGSWNVRF